MLWYFWSGQLSWCKNCAIIFTLYTLSIEVLKIEYHPFKNRNFFPHKTVAGPDLQIMGGLGHSNPAKGGGGGLKTFLLFLPQFGLKIRGGGGKGTWVPRPLP